jgi:repressor of nif and glnA expression
MPMTPFFFCFYFIRCHLVCQFCVLNPGDIIVKSRLTSVENIVTRIENGHGKKLQALFDGYKQHTDQLERIEKEVSKHDEFILRRIK